MNNLEKYNIEKDINRRRNTGKLYWMDTRVCTGSRRVAEATGDKVRN